MQLPGIYVEIKGDYTELEKNLKAAKALVTSQATGISNALNNALTPTKVAGGIDSLIKQFSLLDRASKIPAGNLQNISVELDNLKKITALTEAQWQKMQERFLSNQTSNAQENALKRIASAAGLAREEIRELGQQFGLSDAQIEKVAYSVHGVEKKVRTLADVIRTIPPIQNYLSLPQVGFDELKKSTTGQIEAFVKNLSQLATVGEAGEAGIKAIDRDMEELARQTGLTSDQLREMKIRVASLTAEKAQEQALRAVAVAAGLTRKEIADLGDSMGVQAAGIDRVADALHGAEQRAQTFAERIKNLPKIQLYTEVVQPASLGFERGVQGEASQFASNLIATADAARVAQAAFTLTESELADLQSRVGLTSEQFSVLKDRISSSVADNAQVNAFKALAQGAEMSRAEIQQFGSEMGLSVKQIDKVANALHGAENQADSFAKRIASLPKISQYIDPSIAASASLDKSMQGGEQSLVRNLVSIADASEAARRAFALTDTELEQLGARVGVTGAQLAELKDKVVSVAGEKFKFDSFKNLAESAGLAREETVALAEQMGFSAERAKEVAIAVHGVETAVESLADKIKSLPQLPTLSNLSTVARADLFEGYSGQYTAMAQDLTVLTRAEEMASQAAGAFANDLDELANHAGLTEREIQDLQLRMSSAFTTNVQVDALRRLGQQLGLTNEELEALGRRFGLTAEQIERVISSAEQAEEAIDDVGRDSRTRFDILSGSISMAAGKFLLLEQAAYSVQRILNAIVFDFGATVETATLGIASAFMNNGQYVDQITGKVLTGQQAMNAAMDDARGVIEQLRASNLVTIATLDQLIRAYQEAAPVALSRGFDKSQVEQFTVAMMQAAGAIDTSGMLLHQMGEEVRSLLTGAGISDKNSRIATALGVRPEDIAQFKGDVQGQFDFLMDKLSAYRLFGEQLQKTWKGVASNVVDILKQVSSQATEPIFTAVRDGLGAMTSGIATLVTKTNELGNETRVIAWNPDYIDTIERLKEEVSDVIDAVSRHRGDLGSAFKEMRDGADDAWRAIKETAGAMEIIYWWGNKLLDLGAFDWGVIGYVLLRSGPQAAALTAALVTVNAQLKEFDLNIGGLPGKYADMMHSWGSLGQAMDDVLSGNRDINTGDLLGADQTSRAIDSLQRLLDKLETQKKFSAQHPFISSMFGEGDISKIESDISKVKAAIESLKEQAKKAGDIRWEMKLTISTEEKEQIENEIKRRQDVFERGHKAALQYIKTQREAVIAQFEEISKYLIPGSDELAKAEAKLQEQLAAIDERKAESDRAASLKAEREELKQLSAGIKSYVNDARALAQVSEEWNSDALRNVDAMSRLNDELMVSGLDEHGRAIYEMGKRFEEAAPIFEDFQANIERVEDSIAGLKEAYAAIGQQIEESRSALSGNAAGTDTEDLNKIHQLVEEHKRIGEALEKRKKILIELRQLQRTGVTDFNEYQKKLLADDRSEALQDAYQEFGLVHAETFDMMMAKANAWKENFINRTGEVGLAERLYTEKTKQLRKERAEAMAIDAYNKDGDVTGLMKVGLANFNDELHRDAIDFYMNLLPNAIGGSSDALAQFARDIAQSNASISDSWQALGDSIEDAIFDILQNLIELQLKMTIMSGIGINDKGATTGGGLIGLLSSAFSTGGYHSGGTLGADAPTFTRSVPMSAFFNAPRYHTGLLSDEFPAILQNGESVLTAGQMAAIGKGMSNNLGVRTGESGSNAPKVNIIINNNSSAQATATAKQSDDGLSIDVAVEVIEQRMQNRVNRGYSGVTKRRVR